MKVQIEGRPVFVSDGVISADDVQTGGAACSVWLPAGEVYLTPVPGTAEGKVVGDRQFFQGEEIQDLTLTFKAGKLTSMTAKSGLERLKALYDAAGPGKDEFAGIDIGINPNVHLVPGSRMVAMMPATSCTTSCPAVP
jgi:leucyl aminopeptidase (aminopeptidase T)